MDMPTDVPTAREFLVNNTFIGSMPGEVIDQLVQRGRLQRLYKRGRLFERGDVGDSLMVVLSGTIKISNIDAEGREVVLSFPRAGEVIGEIAVLDGGRRTASGVALEKSELFVIRRDDLVPVLQDHPEALFEIVAVLCERLRSTSEAIEHQARNMAARLAFGLRRLALLHGRRTPRGIAIDLIASQNDLGGYFGLSRTNTSRQLARFAEEGFVATEDGTLYILNDDALRHIVEASGK